MTLTFKRRLERVKMNQRVEYVGQKSFSSKATDRQTDTHTHTSVPLLYLDHYSGR